MTHLRQYSIQSANLALVIAAVCGVFGLMGCDRKAPNALETNASNQGKTDTQNTGTMQSPVAKPEGSSEEASEPSDETFELLASEYENAVKKYRAKLQTEAEAKQKVAIAELASAEKALEEARTDEEKLAAQQRLQVASRFPAMKMVAPSDGPGELFSPRFLAFGSKHSNATEALDALYLALLTSGGPQGKVGTWNGVVKALRDNHVESPELKKAVRLLRMLGNAHEDQADSFLAEVIAKNPDRRASGRACQALAQGRADAAATGERLKTDEGFRKNASQFLGGEQAVEKLIAGAAAAKSQAETLAKTLKEKFSDVCPDLSIGNPAPEVVIKTLDGSDAKLSALKGKVVVLDIWATWCGPCVAMIPHEREMVERLKGKPFELVSISADEEKETLTKFLESKPMPWTHWWNGREGGIIEDWNVEAYPTIYVLDAKGVIRHKNLRGEELESAVNELLQEIESE